MLDMTWTDKEVIDKILKFFSDIPMPAHTITKLRAILQGENEPTVTFNQKYRTILECVERKPALFSPYVRQFLGTYNGRVNTPPRT